MADSLLFIVAPPPHENKTLSIIGMGLLLGVVLFMIHITKDKPPPFTTEITMWTGDERGDVIEVTVEGTVRARTKRNQIHLTAFADQRIVGTVALGDFESGQQKPFRVTGKIPSQSGKPETCHVKLRSHPHSERRIKGRNP